MTQPLLQAKWVAELHTLLKKAKDVFFNTKKILSIRSKDYSDEFNQQLFDLGLVTNSYLVVPSAQLTISDAVYDTLEAFYVKHTTKELPVGSPIRGKKGVELPFSMYSLTQVEGSQLEDWLLANPGPYVVSAKIDGVAVGHKKTGDSRKAYTRGDGTIGGDISRLLPYFKIPDKNDIQVRGEAVIPIKVFNKNWKESFANPRAMMSGLLNPDRKTIHPGIRDAMFYAHELISPRMKPSEALKYLEEQGYNVVPHKVFDTLTIDYLEKLLDKVRSSVPFEMDGLVITCNRKAKPGGLQNSIKFKNNAEDETIEATVKKVEWNLTRTSALFPRIVLEPVQLGGVTVRYCSGKSARRIYELGIGEGAVISIARSGGVIPDLRKVIRAVEPDMPTDLAWEWAGDGIKVASDSLGVLKLSHLVSLLGINGLKEGGLQKFANQGITSTAQFLNLNKKEFEECGGVLVAKAWHQLEDAKKSTSLDVWMYASGVFDRNLGQVRMSAIVQKIPDILTCDQNRLIDRITRIEGFQYTLAQTFAKSLPDFIDWLNSVPSVVPLKRVAAKVIGNKCKGHAVVFTGVRDAETLSTIIREGGTQATSVKKATHILIKDPTFSSSTTREGIGRGITPMLISAYVKKYL